MAFKRCQDKVSPAGLFSSPRKAWRVRRSERVAAPWRGLVHFDTQGCVVSLPLSFSPPRKCSFLSLCYAFELVAFGPVGGGHEAAVRRRGCESVAPHVWGEESGERDESGALHREAFGQDEPTQRYLHDGVHSQGPSRLQV